MWNEDVIVKAGFRQIGVADTQVVRTSDRDCGRGRPARAPGAVAFGCPIWPVRETSNRNDWPNVNLRALVAAHSTGKVLNRLFHGAFFTAKAVHTTTSISNGRVSVAGLAVELASQLFADVARAKVVVIGAGETGELLVQQLLKRGSTNITVVNRSYERGLDLAQRRGIAVGRWDELGDAILQQAREISCEPGNKGGVQT